MVTVKQLQHFRAVLEEGSIHAASEAVSLTQPALTRSIINLEAMLGVKLFDRSKSGMIPTDFALHVAARCEALTLGFGDLEREAELYRSAGGGDLCIGFGQGVRDPLVRSCLPNFVERHPNVSVRIREGTPIELARALQRRELDMIIAGVTSYQQYDFVQAEHIEDLLVRFRVRPGHPLLSLDRVTTRELVRFPSTLPTIFGAQHPAQKLLQSVKGNPFTPNVICSDYSVLESIVLRTDSWTCAPVFPLLRSDLNSLEMLEVDDLEITNSLSFIELSRRSRSQNAQHFIDTVVPVVTGIEDGLSKVQA